MVIKQSKLSSVGEITSQNSDILTSLKRDYSKERTEEEPRLITSDLSKLIRVP